MRKIFIFVLFYTFSFFNTNLLSNEQQQTLKSLKKREREQERGAHTRTHKDPQQNSQAVRE